MSQLSTVQQVLVGSLEGGIERLNLVLGDLTYDQLDLAADRDASPGTWTIREIVHHLADDGDVWSLRIKQALATPGAKVYLDHYPGNEVWAAALDFEDRDCQPALALVSAHLAYLVELLTRFYNGWNRNVVVVDRATGSERSMTVLEIAQMLVEHLDEHITQIQAIRAFNQL
jgi:hypothetical protein